MFMQVISRKRNVEEKPDQDQPSTGAQISLRAVTYLEIASVIISVLITVWTIIPFQPPQRWLVAVPGALALVLIINSQRVRRESLRELGFSTRYFGSAARLLILPTLIACAVFAVIGYANDSFHRNSHFWSTLLFLPFWGTLQQYVLQGFIYRRIRYLLVETNAPPHEQRRQVNISIIATAVIFAFVHLPNPALTVLTLVGGLAWSWIYERAPNLFALGLSHALMSLILITSLPPWLLESMSIGYKHFLYQKF